MARTQIQSVVFPDNGYPKPEEINGHNYLPAFFTAVDDKYWQILHPEWYPQEWMNSQFCDNGLIEHTDRTSHNFPTDGSDVRFCRILYYEDDDEISICMEGESFVQIPTDDKRVYDNETQLLANALGIEIMEEIDVSDVRKVEFEGSLYVFSKEDVFALDTMTRTAEIFGRALFRWVGPTGSGKTDGAKIHAIESGLPYYQLDINAHSSEPEALFEERTLIDGNTAWKYTELSQFLITDSPRILILNEASRARRNVLQAMMSCFDNTLTFTGYNNRVHCIGKNLMVIVCENYGGDYIDAGMHDSAMASRFKPTYYKAIPSLETLVEIGLFEIAPAMEFLEDKREYVASVITRYANGFLTLVGIAEELDIVPNTRDYLTSCRSFVANLASGVDTPGKCFVHAYASEDGTIDITVESAFANVNR